MCLLHSGPGLVIGAAEYKATKTHSGHLPISDGQYPGLLASARPDNWSSAISETWETETGIEGFARIMLTFDILVWIWNKCVSRLGKLFSLRIIFWSGLYCQALVQFNYKGPEPGSKLKLVLPSTQQTFLGGWLQLFNHSSMTFNNVLLILHSGWHSGGLQIQLESRAWHWSDYELLTAFVQ